MPARSCIPPGASKSFCMSITTTAVCRRSTPTGDGLAAISISQLDSIGDLAQRVEKLADRWLFYTDDSDVLREKMRALALPPGSVWLRGGVLEDVFLALTGRGLLD